MHRSLPGTSKAADRLWVRGVLLFNDIVAESTSFFFFSSSLLLLLLLLLFLLLNKNKNGRERWKIDNNNSPCARGQIRAKSDPCSTVDVFGRNGLRGFFCLAQVQFFLVAISLQPITKLSSFLLKYFAVALNYLPKEWILRGESARVLASSCSQHSRRASWQLIAADDRKEETTLPSHFTSLSRI